MSTVSLPGGETIWYRRHGEARGGRPPLLHIHGSAFGHRNFEKLTPLMAAHGEVIDFDLPGFGESRSGAATPSDMHGIARQVRDFIAALGVSRVDVHGTSFGAMIALTLAADSPHLVDRLVLSCFLARYDQAARMMRATWKRAARESGMAAVADLTSVAGFARGFYDRGEAAAQLQAMREAFGRTEPEAFIAGTETIERTDLSPLVGRVRAEVLLLAGAEDNMTPLHPAASGFGMDRIAEALPGSTSIVLAGCGHYLVIEQPEAAMRAIVDFLSRPREAR